MLLITFNGRDRTFPINFPNQRIEMKNLKIVIHILLSVFLLGCAEKGVYVGEKKDGKRHGQGTLTFLMEESMKGNLRMVNKMVKEQKLILMEVVMKENGRMAMVRFIRKDH